MHDFFARFPFSPNMYGAVVGVAVCVGIVLCEKKARAYQISENVFWSVVMWAIAGGVVGARGYHVITDIALYKNAPIDAVKIWNGGLSIIGALLGGGAAVAAYMKFWPDKQLTPKKGADIAAFGIPFAQAVGRLGNFFNQELYGLPTNLPWKIFIDPQHRLPGFTQFAYYHPLFAYEMIGTALLGLMLWRLEKRHTFPVGSGMYFLFYLFMYSALRFCLDFLRLDKTVLRSTRIGVNQVVLIFVMILSGGSLVLQLQKNQKK